MKIIWGIPPQTPSAYLLWKRRIAARLDQALKREKMTLEELALKSGLPLKFLKKVHAGQLYPSYKARSAMEKAFGLKMETLER